MKTQAINIYTNPIYKPISFRSGLRQDSVTPINTTPNADTTQFKSTVSHDHHKKTLIGKISAMFKTPPGIEKTDPRYSESPEIRSFLY